MSLTDTVLLNVPREWAEEYEKLAEQENITGRGIWAIKARQVLKQYLDGELVPAMPQGTEQEAAQAGA